MLSSRRLAAVACAAGLALGGLAVAPTAGATPAPAPVATSTCPLPLAAQWIVDQWKTDPASFQPGTLAEAVFALSTTDTDPAVIRAMVAQLGTSVGGYTNNPGGAAKIAIAVMATGADPRQVNGTDLIALLEKQVAADPTAGGLWNLPYVVIALSRAGQTVPQPVVDALVKAQDAAGAYGFADWQDPTKFVVDADTTGAAMTALAALMATQQGGEPVASAADKAMRWAIGAQRADGSWSGYSPVNSTAMVMQGLRALDNGQADAKAIAYLKGQQAKVAGGAFSNVPDGTEADLLATVQGQFGLGTSDYYRVSFHPRTCTNPSPSAPASTPAASPSVTPSSSAPRPPKLPETGR